LLKIQLYSLKAAMKTLRIPVWEMIFLTLDWKTALFEAQMQ
jgi:hypothetical protein